ncbi:MAG: hypothetical protein GY696_20265, partial [Gammaproteobacteria bacterium]|nr:hypothetical protein [Gammaproteobacteria bacterium]
MSRTQCFEDQLWESQRSVNELRSLLQQRDEILLKVRSDFDVASNANEQLQTLVERFQIHCDEQASQIAALTHAGHQSTPVGPSAQFSFSHESLDRSQGSLAACPPVSQLGLPCESVTQPLSGIPVANLQPNTVLDTPRRPAMVPIGRTLPLGVPQDTALQYIGVVPSQQGMTGVSGVQPTVPDPSLQSVPPSRLPPPQPSLSHEQTGSAVQGGNFYVSNLLVQLLQRQQPALTRPKAQKLPKPEQFSEGTKHTRSIESFFAEYDRWAEISDMNEELRLQHLVSCFGGPAKDHCRMLVSRGLSYRSVTDTLIKRYGGQTRAARISAQKELANLSLRPSESVIALSTRLERLYERAHPDADLLDVDHMLELEACFYAALPQNYQKKLLGLTGYSYSRVLDRANELQQLDSKFSFSTSSKAFQPDASQPVQFHSQKQ